MTSKTCMQLRVQDLLKKKRGGGIREYFLIKKEVFFVKQDLRGDGPQSL